MKFLLIFFIVLILAWRWRTWRAAEHVTKQKPASDKAAANMVACRQCGVHVPASEAIVGAHGTYCSVAHRLTMEP